MSDVFSRVSAALAERYALERELGHGGMATVYLARDPKHTRMVAVKVLRPELAASLGPARFLHEIEIAAQLQHPHILPLLDSGEAAGFLYYVMPYVDGESLRERLDRKGELPVPEAVRILVEVADALAYAHSHDVVHRDMKPDNIMLSGRHPLVMDFGIAKAVNPTPGSQHPTTAGVALGTPAYMAPEQAAADPHLDHRVDIYALGVIGYELLTGNPPFGGGSSQQVLAAHMTQRPEPISSRRPSIPPRLATIIMQCLEKRPADRPQTAEEILQTIEAMLTPSEGFTPTGTRPVSAARPGISRGALVGSALVLTLGVGGLLWSNRGTAPSVAVGRHVQLTFAGNVAGQEISPDGQLLAYIEDGERLVVKDLTGGSIIPITKVGSRWSTLHWSPDGLSLLYLGRDSANRRIAALFPRLGGNPRNLPIPDTSGLAQALLSPDGSRLAWWYTNTEPGLTVAKLATGEKRRIKVPPERFLDDGDWSPDGRFIALSSTSKVGEKQTLWAVNVETGAGYEVVSDTLFLSAPRWSKAGNALYYIRNRNELCSIPFPTPKGSIPEVLVTGLSANDFSITADGKTLTYTKSQSHSNLWLATQAPGERRFTSTQLTQGTAIKSPGRLSPDGRLIAFVQAEQGKPDLFVLSREGGVPRRITSGGSVWSAPAWAPDGQRIAFFVTDQRTLKVRTVRVEGGEERTYEQTNAGQGQGISWAPLDHILYQGPGHRNFFRLDPATQIQKPLIVNDSVGWMFDPIPSRDKEHVVVFWNRPPRRGPWVISLRDSTQKPIGPANSWAAGWSADGKSVYVEEETSHRILRVPVRGGRDAFVATNPFKEASCEVTERGRILDLLCGVYESVSDVWMIENFEPGHRP